MVPERWTGGAVSSREPTEFRSSISELYRRQQPHVLRRARAILRDEEAARDVTQDVFIRALRGISALGPGVAPSTWLYRVTTNCALNWKRDHARRHRLLAARAPAIATTTRSAEDRVAVAELLALVPAELGEVAVYYYLDELEQEEIAALVGIARRTVGHRLAAFRAAARTSLTLGD